MRSQAFSCLAGMSSRLAVSEYSSIVREKEVREAAICPGSSSVSSTVARVLNHSGGEGLTLQGGRGGGWSFGEGIKVAADGG